MNDLATYRIDVSWLWTLVFHEAVITKDGYFQKPNLTEDGMVLAPSTEAVKAGTRFTRELFDKVWRYHHEWTTQFFAELDRMGDPGRFDRSKAPVIMELLKRQLLSPHYIQHSARVLFVLAQAGEDDRKQILDAIFDLTRDEIGKRVEAGSMQRAALAAHDYVYDIFAEGKQVAAR
jgi:malate synthase